VTTGGGGGGGVTGGSVGLGGGGGGDVVVVVTVVVFVVVVVGLGRPKTAFVDVSLLIVSLQGSFWPAQAPVQALKTAPASGVAVSVTAVSFARPVSVQVTPHAIPGRLVTVPVPSPLLLTASVKPTNLRRKKCSEHESLVVQTPVIVNELAHGTAEGEAQPCSTTLPGSGVAVSVIVTLGRMDLKTLRQVEVPSGRPCTNRQSMPAGELVTLASPLLDL
jgi:hypothetical protein